MKRVTVFVAVLFASSWVAAEPRWETRNVVQRIEPRVRISGGWFELGSDDAELARAKALCGEGCDPAKQFGAEKSAHRVYVRAFAIDRFEVSNGEHQRCVSAGRCFPPRGEAGLRAELPVASLTWAEAREYCRFAGGDLPSEAQWEYAAHGSSKRSFPWGDGFEAKLVAGGAPRAVDENAAGKSFFGLLNMAGNVWELVLDRFQAPYAGDVPSVDPVDLRAGERVLRGGSWRSPAFAVRTRYRAAVREDEARDDVGFRCAYPVTPALPAVAPPAGGESAD